MFILSTSTSSAAPVTPMVWPLLKADGTVSLELHSSSLFPLDELSSQIIRHVWCGNVEIMKVVVAKGVDLTKIRCAGKILDKKIIANLRGDPEQPFHFQHWTLLHLACAHQDRAMAVFLHTLAPNLASQRPVDPRGYVIRSPIQILSQSVNEQACVIFQAMCEAQPFELTHTALEIRPFVEINEHEASFPTYHEFDLTPLHEIVHHGNDQMMEQALYEILGRYILGIAKETYAQCHFPARVVNLMCGYLSHYADCERLINVDRRPPLSTIEGKIRDRSHLRLDLGGFSFKGNKQTLLLLSECIYRHIDLQSTLTCSPRTRNFIRLLIEAGSNLEETLTFMSSWTRRVKTDPIGLRYVVDPIRRAALRRGYEDVPVIPPTRLAEIRKCCEEALALAATEPPRSAPDYSARILRMLEPSPKPAPTPPAPTSATSSSSASASSYSAPASRSSFSGTSST